MRSPHLPQTIWRVVVLGRKGYQTTLGSRTYTDGGMAMGYVRQQRRQGHTARVFRTETAWVEAEDE